MGEHFWNELFSTVREFGVLFFAGYLSIKYDRMTQGRHVDAVEDACKTVACAVSRTVAKPVKAAAKPVKAVHAKVTKPKSRRAKVIPKGDEWMHEQHA